MKKCTPDCYGEFCIPCKDCPESISHDEEWARQADAALKRRKEKNIPWEKS